MFSGRPQDDPIRVHGEQKADRLNSAKKLNWLCVAGGQGYWLRVRRRIHRRPRSCRKELWSATGQHRGNQGIASRPYLKYCADYRKLA